MEKLELYIPRLEELWFYQQMTSDPETMSYNAGWDVDYAGYHRDTGCIDCPDEALADWYDRWIGNEPDCFYAYIKRSLDGDMDSWVTRTIHESAVIGGDDKTLYEVGPNKHILSVNTLGIDPAVVTFWQRLRGDKHTDEHVRLLLLYHQSIPRRAESIGYRHRGEYHSDRYDSFQLSILN